MHVLIMMLIIRQLRSELDIIEQTKLWLFCFIFHKICTIAKEIDVKMHYIYLIIREICMFPLNSLEYNRTD